MHVLAIHAHPDDVEFLAAGTLALLRHAGHQVTIVTMTAGDCGSRHHGPVELTRLRTAEAAKSASLIGAAYRCAGFGDMSIFNDDASRRRVTELLREIAPDVVLTASPSDYHADHEATSVLVRDAAFNAPIPNYDCGSAEPMPDIPHLYFMDPVEGLDREGRPIKPHFVVDISSVFELKKSMLACHETQRRWLQEHHHMDSYLDEMERWTKARGGLRWVTYGEGFRAYHCHPYPRTPKLEEALAGFV